MFTRRFRRHVRRAGLPPIRLHDVRHTYATAALAAGVPVKVVSERLGHATTAITENLYMHVLPGMDRTAADLVAGLILQGAPERSATGLTGPSVYKSVYNSLFGLDTERR